MNISNLICKRKLSNRGILFIVFVLLIVIILQLTSSSIDDDEEWYKHPDAYFEEVPCQNDEYTQELYAKLTKKMINVFEKLNIKYFLCYGSLWGALKFKKTLPWDRNIDMCIIHNQLVIIDEQTLYQAFKQNDLQYYYNSRRGKYIVKYKTVSGEITVFEKVGNHMERVGWAKRLAPHLYLNYQRFPYQLIEGDLTKMQFNNVKVFVPNQQFELQKYLYPENWWKEIKPKGCL